MRDFTKPAKLIISAERYNLSAEENAKRHQELGAAIKAQGSRAIEVDGVFDGVSEKSWLIFSPQGLQLDLAKKFDQDAVLHIDWEDTATLYDNAGNVIDVGVFKETKDPAGRDHTKLVTEAATYYYVVDWKLSKGAAAA